MKGCQIERIDSVLKSCFERADIRKASWFLDDPHSIRLLYGNNPERTRGFVANLSSTLIKQNTFSRCLNVPSEKRVPMFGSAYIWMAKTFGVDSLDNFEKDSGRSLVVLHNMDGIQYRPSLWAFVKDMINVQSTKKYQFLMTTCDKTTYNYLLTDDSFKDAMIGMGIFVGKKEHRINPKDQYVKPLIHRT